jgi:glutaredoxin
MRIRTSYCWPLYLLCGTLLGVPFGLQAGIFKWVDEDGRVHFSDRLPVEVDAETVRLREINTYEEVSIEDGKDMGSNQPQVGKAKKVVMYSAPWCGVCKQARQFFKARGIPFREMDVERSTMARRELERMNARGVPVILVGGKRMNGFSEQRFMALYEN